MSDNLSVAYSLRYEGGLRLDIALVETDRLLLHEETIPEMLDGLTHSIRKDRVLRAPIVVDSESLVVLDGMHRVKALRTLRCRFICACLVDYKNPLISVERWCRTISNQFDEKKAAVMADELGLRLLPRTPRHNHKIDGAYPVLAFAGLCYKVLTPNADTLSAFEAVQNIELKLRDMGLEVGYETAQNAEEKLRWKAVRAVLYPPRVGKKQVLEAAKTGRVLTFKATRHVIPARPVGVDVPLRLLQDDRLSVVEANERLSSMLNRKKLRYVPSMGVWRSRHYEEGLYIFE